MTRLFLIDHSLAENGGHHFRYAHLLATAALQRGWQPIVASHWIFRLRRKLWTVDCPLEPIYLHSAYGPWVATQVNARSPVNPLRDRTRVGTQGERTADSQTNGSHPQPPARRRSLTSWFRDRWKRWKQLGRVYGFSSATQRLFRKYGFQDGDIVFLSSTNDFDMVGLSEFWVRCPMAARAAWHLQFHSQLVKGFWAGSDSQLERMAELREHFQELLARAPHLRPYWYTPTPPLAEQYRQLDIGPVHALMDFVSVPRHVPRTEPVSPAAPLRVVCAGEMRIGKSGHMLKMLVRELARSEFADGRLQVWVQAKNTQGLLRMSEGRPWVTALPQGPLPPATAKLVHVPHPLSTSDYIRLMELANVGLLPYRADSYGPRCSGVQVEYLASGIPVVVPAQTWMAMELEQVGGGPQHAPGLAARDDHDYPRLLLEIVDRFEEFQARALRAAPEYARQHSPEAVLDFLLNVQAANV